MSATTFAAAMFALRAVLGIVFVAHGVKHFVNRQATIDWTASIGLRQPKIQWAFMSFAELAIGLAMLTGLLTTFAAAGLVAMMVVAFWTVHRHSGFFVSARPDEGYEYVLVLAVVAVVVAVLGPGEWSIDHALEITETFDGSTGALIALGGVGAALAQLATFYRPGVN